MQDGIWALQVEPKNFQAIMSEAGGEFNRDFLEEWNIKSPEGGYFVRNSRMPSGETCTLVSMDHFFTLYRFERPPTCTDPECDGAYFRPLEKLK